jgi:nucleotide-binding universal stress UspA family protein
LCAVDLGAESAATLRWASEFAQKAGASLEVAHAVPTSEGLPSMQLDREFVAALLGSAKETIAETLKKAGVEAETHVEAGTPSHVVRDLVKKTGADIVIVARGAAAEGLGRLRGHDYSIICDAPCPVISV